MPPGGLKRGVGEVETGENMVGGCVMGKAGKGLGEWGAEEEAP